MYILYLKGILTVLTINHIRSQQVTTNRPKLESSPYLNRKMMFNVMLAFEFPNEAGFIDSRAINDVIDQSQPFLKNEGL